MAKLITIIGKNGVEYTVSLTGEQADYYLRLAQMRASSDSEVMKEFVELLLNSSKPHERQNKAQYN
ncbi:MAG TPA: hypothetical protein VFA09_02970 [Ktedonobacteraceae bacterium]|nr:hypothetical protein [Ktedonobacteraceae bacterium]